MRPGTVKIAIVDGQGGGIGKNLVSKLKAEFPEAELLAFGTNSTATGQMMAAGADEGATGENAIVVNMSRVDIIIGVVGILAANSMMGELTPAMAEAVGASHALKILIPFNRCGIFIVGTEKEKNNLSAYIDQAVEKAKEYCNLLLEK